MGCGRNSWLWYLYDLAWISTWKLKTLVGKQQGIVFLECKELCVSGIAEALWKWHSECVTVCVTQRKEEGSVLWFSRGCFVSAHWEWLLYSALLASLRLWIHHLQLKCSLFRGRVFVYSISVFPRGCWRRGVWEQTNSFNVTWLAQLCHWTETMWVEHSFLKCRTCSVYKLPPSTTAVLSLMKYLFETPFPFDFFACNLTRRDRGIADC